MPKRGRRRPPVVVVVVAVTVVHIVTDNDDDREEEKLHLQETAFYLPWEGRRGGDDWRSRGP